MKLSWVCGQINDTMQVRRWGRVSRRQLHSQGRICGCWLYAFRGQWHRVRRGAPIWKLLFPPCLWGKCLSEALVVVEINKSDSILVWSRSAILPAGSCTRGIQTRALGPRCRRWNNQILRQLLDYGKCYGHSYKLLRSPSFDKLCKCSCISSTASADYS